MTSVIGALVGFIYRVFFLKGEEGFRLASTWVKLLFLASSLYLLMKQGFQPALANIATVLALSLMWPGFEWFTSGSLISLIPALWFSATAYISWLLGLPGVSLTGALNILVRTISISLTILFFASAISPVRLSNILLRIGAPSYYPLLVWRTMPYGMRVLLDSVQIGVMKGEKPHKRLAPAVAIMLEYGSYVEEYNWFKFEGKPAAPLPSRGSMKHTLMLAVASALEIALGALFP